MAILSGLSNNFSTYNLRQLCFEVNLHCFKKKKSRYAVQNHFWHITSEFHSLYFTTEQTYHKSIWTKINSTFSPFAVLFCLCGIIIFLRGQGCDITLTSRWFKGHSASGQHSQHPIKGLSFFLFSGQWMWAAATGALLVHFRPFTGRRAKHRHHSVQNMWYKCLLPS